MNPTFDMEPALALADALWRKRRRHEARWREIAEYVFPDRACFDAPGGEAEQDGREKIFDTTPEEAADLLACSMHALLTNPACAWFALELPGAAWAGEAVTAWLDEVQGRMLAVFNDPAGRFNTEVSSFYADLVTFGWGVFYSEDAPGLPPRFVAVPPGECAVEADGRGNINTLCRRFALSLPNAREMFPEADFGDLGGDEGPEARLLEVRHLVLPAARLPQSPCAGFPWLSCYFLREGKRLLRLRGFYEFPYLVPRWSRPSGDVYGRGPGWRALPDMRVLNVVAEAQMRAAEKQADPPLLVPDDGVVGDIRAWAGGITWFRPSGGEIRPLPAPADLTALQTILEARRSAVRAAFLNDRIQLAGGPQMTATEVLSRENRQMTVLGPVLGRMQSEFLGPLIERVFQMLRRRGELPEPPPELRGRTLGVRYVSPIARAQKQGEARALMQALQFAAPFLENGRGMDNFDADAVVRDSRELFGYPARYLRPPEEVARLRLAQGQV